METRVAFKDGGFLPYEQLAVGIATHALHYGTNVFEGMRAYWNAEAEQLFVFRPEDHYARLRVSARFYGMALPDSLEDLCSITVDLLRRNSVVEDVYIRPIFFISSEGIGLWRADLEDSLVIFHTPMGKYIAEGGIRCCISPWRRLPGATAPTRAKIGGVYACMALVRRQAMEAGYDEAITLTVDGKVAEGSAENIFLVIDGKLVTPSLGGDVLAGITRASIIELASRELGLPTVERDVNPSELAFADEVFLCGTAAEITPVVEIDGRRVGDGEVGPVSASIADLYGRVVRGGLDRYTGWCAPVYGTTSRAHEDAERAEFALDPSEPGR
jgi:branched-chain amino acid aminotransferase